MATTNVVNLDAHIPRRDFQAVSTGPSFSTILRLSITDLDTGFLIPTLHKPDFQRETKDWSPNKVLDLIKTFVDGELIPAVILWQAGGTVFVIDGAHRLSALLAWIRNDYGDGTSSKTYFDIYIPEEQLKVAERTRVLVHSEIGSYADFQIASKNPANIVTRKMRERVSRLGSCALVVQWVPAENVQAAETSFFKINEAATPVDKTEIKIIKGRLSATAIASRAIVNRGVGHEYWGHFGDTTRSQIANMGKHIYGDLFLPPLSEPIKTLDIPVGGHGYNTLPFIFDLVNMVNEVRIFDSTRLDEAAISALADKDGSKTVNYMMHVKNAMARMTGTGSMSIGPHPAVYFYTRGGAFQPAAFLATWGLLDKFEKGGQLKAFTKVRAEFEQILIYNKEFITRAVHKFGAGNRSVSPLMELFTTIIDGLQMDLKEHQILQKLAREPKYNYLIIGGPPDLADAKGGGFSRRTKSAAYLQRAFINPIRCSLCGAMLHSKSIEVDHVVRREDGGLAVANNADVSHGYCNSTYKN